MNGGNLMAKCDTKGAGGVPSIMKVVRVTSVGENEATSGNDGIRPKTDSDLLMGSRLAPVFVVVTTCSPPARKVEVSSKQQTGGLTIARRPSWRDRGFGESRLQTLNGDCFRSAVVVDDEIFRRSLQDRVGAGVGSLK